MDSYTFIRPDDNRDWYIRLQEDLNDVVTFEAGHSIQVSESCNPNFLYSVPYSSDPYDCDRVKHFDMCTFQVNFLIGGGNLNINGIYETALQCPQCGCGSEGAANLDDLYAAELDGSRKVSDVANTIFKNHFNITE